MGDVGMPYGMIPQEEWLNMGFEVRRQNDPIDALFGDIKTNNLVAYWQNIANEYQIPMMAEFHGFDTEAKTTFRIPIDTRNIEKGLIKVKLNQSEKMREYLKNGAGEQELIDFVINDGIRLADQVVTRTKVAKNELMATGKVTIKENNQNLTVDYGVKSNQTSFSFDLSADADVSTQIQDIVDQANDAGVIITGMMTSKKNITKMSTNSTLQKAINGNIGVGARVRNADLKDYLNEEFGIMDVITNDLTYATAGKIGKDGRPTVVTHRYYPSDKVTFFASNPNGQLGVGLWGNPPEVDLGEIMAVSQNGVSPYVYITQWVEKDPAVLWTKASSLFMPVLYNPSSLWIATVQPAA